MPPPSSPRYVRRDRPGLSHGCRPHVCAPCGALYSGSDTGAPRPRSATARYRRPQVRCVRPARRPVVVRCHRVTVRLSTPRTATPSWGENTSRAEFRRRRYYVHPRTPFSAFGCRRANDGGLPSDSAIWRSDDSLRLYWPDGRSGNIALFPADMSCDLKALLPADPRSKGTSQMEISERRRGRPPAPPQTLPLFLHEAHSRVRYEVIISGFMIRELRGYVEWAGRLTMMAPNEVMVRTVDRALAEYFKRDKLWRKDRDALLVRRDSNERRARFRSGSADEQPDATENAPAADTNDASSHMKSSHRPPAHRRRCAFAFLTERAISGSVRALRYAERNQATTERARPGRSPRAERANVWHHPGEESGARQATPHRGAET